MDVKQIAGQINLFEEKPVTEINECLGEPCAHLNEEVTNGIYCTDL